MANTTRVKKAKSKFAGYILSVNNRQLDTEPVSGNPYWQEYGWTSAESIRVNKFTTDTLALYVKYEDANQVTSVIRKSVGNIIDDFVKYEKQHMLIDKIIVSGIATVSDAAIFNFVLEKDEDNTHLSAKLPGIPVPEVESVGSGDIEIHVKQGTDSSRASIPKKDKADSVQYAYAIVNNMVDVDDNPDNENLHTGTSTRAHFIIPLGGGKSRKILVIFFRWYNTKFPLYAGTWSSAVIKSIS